MSKKKRFRDVKIGEWFKELPDKWGGAWVFSLQKLADVEVQDVIMNAGRGSLLLRFEDNDVVEVI